MKKKKGSNFFFLEICKTDKKNVTCFKAFYKKRVRASVWEKQQQPKKTNQPEFFQASISNTESYLVFIPPN